MTSMAQGEHLLLLPPHSSSPSPPPPTAPLPSPLHQSLFCLPLCRQIIESGSATLGGAGGHFGKDPQLPSSAGCSSPCSVLDNSSFRSPRFSPQFRFATAASSSGQPPGVVGLAILVESEASPLPGEDSPSPRFGPVNRRWADYGCFSHPSPRNPNTNYNFNTNINTNVNTGPSPGPNPSAPNKWIRESESPNAHRQSSPPICIGSKSDLQWAKRGQRRIFSTGSPISCSDEDLPLPSDFLQACFFCKLAFCTGKDIYMYRGDRGFCSVECRERQILMDEERTSSSMKKKAPHDTTKMAAGA